MKVRHRILVVAGLGVFLCGTVAARQNATQPQPAAAHVPREVVELMRRIRDHVRGHADYVGDKFAEEARKLARFKHPAIVNVADVFEANGTAYMVLSYEEFCTHPQATMARIATELLGIDPATGCPMPQGLRFTVSRKRRLTGQGARESATSRARDAR